MIRLTLFWMSRQLGVLTLPEATENENKHEQAVAVMIICDSDNLGCKCKMQTFQTIRQLWRLF